MKEINGIYAKRREKALFAQRRRKEEALKQIPQLQALLGTFLNLQQQRAYASLSGQDQQLQQIEFSMQQNLVDQQKLLVESGLNPDHLALQPHCLLCNDYGHIGQKRCTCYDEILQSRKEPVDFLRDFEKQNFDSFDLSIFPEQNEQRKNMEKLQRFTQTYVQNFPENPKRNLVLMGSAGLGKSFMLNCIGQAVHQKGYVVQKITANEFMRRVLERVIAQREPGALRPLERADLLLFDDLGCEPRVNDLISQYLYALLEERMQKERPFVLATNLDIQEINAQYGERIFSRLFHRSVCNVFALSGKDIRLWREK